MQETEKSSSGKPLTLDQLLELKRLEKPPADFWAGFERELQQKQLQALVRPSWWARLQAAVSSAPAYFAPVSTAAILCLTAGLVVFPFLGREDAARRSAVPPAAPAPVESFATAEAATESASAGAGAEAESVALAPQPDFVVDAIIPEPSTPAAASFKTYYVVNAFTIGPPMHPGARDGALEF